jgi:hypothetical protein
MTPCRLVYIHRRLQYLLPLSLEQRLRMYWHMVSEGLRKHVAKNTLKQEKAHLHSYLEQDSNPRPQFSGCPRL